MEQQNSKVFYGVSKRIHSTASGQSQHLIVIYSWDTNQIAKIQEIILFQTSELPPLVQSGFNPSFIATVSHEKGSGDTSEFEITYGRNMDVTHAIKDQHIMATVI